MRSQKIFLSVIAVAVLAANSFAAEKYEIDVTHSVVGFTVRHLVVAKVSGKFKEVAGTILYDEQDITKSSVNVTIKTASIDTDNERRDTHLRSADFFDVANHPDITFVSKKIEKKGDGYVAVGDLTIRSVTKEVSLPFKVLGKIKDWEGNWRIGIEANLAINRFDYGVKWDNKFDGTNLVVGENVEIQLAVEAAAVKQ